MQPPVNNSYSICNFVKDFLQYRLIFNNIRQKFNKQPQVSWVVKDMGHSILCFSGASKSKRSILPPRRGGAEKRLKKPLRLGVSLRENKCLIFILLLPQSRRLYGKSFSDPRREKGTGWNEYPVPGFVILYIEGYFVTVNQLLVSLSFSISLYPKIIRLSLRWIFSTIIPAGTFNSMGAKFQMPLIPRLMMNEATSLA